MDHTFRVTIATAVALAAAGCGGGDGIPREPVSGKVMLDGSALDNGLITFTPEDISKPAAGTAIKDGSYSLGRSDGPSVRSAQGRYLEPEADGKKAQERRLPRDIRRGDEREPPAAIQYRLATGGGGQARRREPFRLRAQQRQRGLQAEALALTPIPGSTLRWPEFDPGLDCSARSG